MTYPLSGSFDEQYTQLHRDLREVRRELLDARVGSAHFSQLQAQVENLTKQIKKLKDVHRDQLKDFPRTTP